MYYIILQKLLKKFPVCSKYVAGDDNFGGQKDDYGKLLVRMC